MSQLAKERQVIQGAPIDFFAAILLAGLLGWLGLRFLYRERMESLKEIVALYRDRHGPLDRESKTPLGKLRNPSLRRKVEETARGLDDLVGKLNAAIVENVPQQSQESFDRRAANLMGASQHIDAHYEKNFKQDAILLRAEMLWRIRSHGLSDPGPATTGMGEMAFDHPTNMFGFREVASELRRLARLLP